MSNKAARRIVRKGIEKDKLLVNRGQAKRMLVIYDKKTQQQYDDLVEDFERVLTEMRTQLEERIDADRKQSWWRRFLGLNPKAGA